MLISALLAKILIGLLYVLFIYGMAMLWKKFKKKPVAGGTVGFFVGLVPFGILFALPISVTIIKGGTDYGVYWAYGTPNYEKSNGETIKLACSFDEAIFINDSEGEYVIEEVIYGFHMPEDIAVEPMSHILIDSPIDYFFDDEPPMEIEVEVGKYASRYWLRTSESYYSDY